MTWPSHPSVTSRTHEKKGVTSNRDESTYGDVSVTSPNVNHTSLNHTTSHQTIPSSTTSATCHRKLNDVQNDDDISLQIETLKSEFRKNSEEEKRRFARRASVLSTCVFLYVTAASTYIMCVYVLPHQYRNHATLWLHRCLVQFIALQTILNWYLLRTTNNDVDTTRPEYSAYHAHNAYHAHKPTTPNYGAGASVHQNLPINHAHRESSSVLHAHNSYKVNHDAHYTPHAYRAYYEPASPTSALPWSHCARCRRPAPPRAHHCKICDRCVLKRDHHCHMTGVCVGLRNQRYFTVMVFYVTLSLAYLPSLYRYLTSLQHGYEFDVWDFILPVTIYRTLFANLPFHLFIIITCLYGGWFVIILGPGFLINQLYLIVTGYTTYEHKIRKRIKCHLSLNARFREVFGPYWAVNWLVPLTWFRQECDGIVWEGYRDADHIGQTKNV